MIPQLKEFLPRIPELIRLSIPSEDFTYDAAAVVFEMQSLEKLCNRILNSENLNLTQPEYAFHSAANSMRREISFLRRELKQLKKGKNTILLIALLKILSEIQPAAPDINVSQIIYTINQINLSYENKNP